MEVYGEAGGALAGLPVAAALGDQHAALFGQTCFAPGDAKCTYGTGSFLLMNTGDQPVHSANGLLTTVGYKIGDEPATYALEGSIAVTGALVQWFRDKLGLIGSAPEIETLARSVDDNGGCYFVPAFSGLFAPHWRSDARGVIAGLTGYISKGHLARAVLEATAWQTREVVDAMNSDAGVDAHLAQGRRRHDREQPADAVARRRARRAGRAADRRRDAVARRRVRGRASRSASGPTSTRSARSGTRPPSGCRRWSRRCATRATASGGRPSRGRSTGSTRTTTEHADYANARVSSRRSARTAPRPCAAAGATTSRPGPGGRRCAAPR